MRNDWDDSMASISGVGLVLDSIGLDVTHDIQTSLPDSTLCYKKRMILILEVSTPGWKSYITINTEVNPDTICKTRSLCYILSYSISNMETPAGL